MGYPFQTIEPKWQQYWEDHQTFATDDRKERVVTLSTLQLGPRAGGPS